jgi:radical SAM protein with 4Fe4S-binding SPASM domain
VVDSLAAAADKPLLILTGGEPLSRSDVWTIARRATAGGLRVVMAPCGVSVDEVAIRHMSEAGIAAISLSVDGATAEQHDAFRGVPGAFAATLKAMDCARRGGLPFQVNALVSRETAGVLPMIHELALREGAFQLDLFFLVPVGRGAGMKEFALGAAASEAALEWAVTMNARGPLRIKTTCAPQVVRVRQRLDLPTPKARHGSPAGGCMAGRGFAFISSLGMLQPCGFCDVPAGDLRQAGFDVLAAYRDAAVFRQLRDVDGYGGKCGRCEFRRVCGGCRARALAASGDYLAEEPSCLHQPSLAHPDSGRASRVVEGCAPGRAAPRILDLKIPAKQRRGGMFPT